MLPMCELSNIIFTLHGIWAEEVQTKYSRGCINSSRKSNPKGGQQNSQFVKSPFYVTRQGFFIFIRKFSKSIRS